MKRATELSPGDKAVAAEYAKLLAKKKTEGEQDRNLYRKMFKEVNTSPRPSKGKPAQKSGYLVRIRAAGPPDRVLFSNYKAWLRKINV